MMARMAPYWELCKPRISFMVALTCALGFWLAGGRDGRLLFWTLAGTVMASFAAGCLNQLFEQEADASMRRTRLRPLPQGRVSPAHAMIFGEVCALSGFMVLWAKVNLLAACLALATVVVYVAAYTPLKKVTPWSTWFGSAAGAVPPLIGWAAAAGRLEPLAWVLFGIQFLWQIPHFLALFWIYRKEYAEAGFRVMPVVDGSGRATALQIAIHSFAVVPVSLLPGLWGPAGMGYSAGALTLGLGYMSLGMKTSWTMKEEDARRLFLASLAYLPLIFIWLMVSI